MGIKLEIYAETAEEVLQQMALFVPGQERVVGMSPTLGAPFVGEAGPQEVVADAGPNPTLGEAPKRRGRPAKALVINGTTNPVPSGSEKSDAGSSEPEGASAQAASPTTAPEQETPAPASAKVITIDEARTAMKAVAALPNGQDLCYAVLSEMGVRNTSEAFVKDAAKFIALCAAKVEAAKVAA